MIGTKRKLLSIFLITMLIVNCVPALSFAETCNHELETLSAVEPTCTEEGLTEGKYCRICENVIEEQEVVPASGHIEVVLPGIEPSCTEEGVSDGMFCLICDVITVEQDIIPATGHKEEVLPGIEPTCTEEGVSDGAFCTICGDVTQEQYIMPSAGHQEVVMPGIEATCLDEGISDGKFCEICLEVILEQYLVPATGHTFDNWVITIDPTCTEAGVETGTCTCGEKETRPVEPLKHDYEAVVTNPTCTEKGFSTYTCKNDPKHTYIDDYVEALGHSFGNWEITTDPTCTEAGVETGICACGEKETRPVEPLKHDYEAVVTNPTCTEKGFSTYTCKNDPKHTYIDDYVEALGHSFGNWEITTDPTCTEAGAETRTCSCGEKETSPVDPLKHDYEAKVTAATCTEFGFTTYTCKNDPTHTYVDDEVEASGHVFEEYVNTTKAGFGQKGELTAKCLLCQDKTDTKDIAAVVVPVLKSYTFDNKAKKPTVTVVDEKGNKIPAKVSYAKGRKAVGRYAVKITLTGDNYSGTETVYFSINPAAKSISKVSAGKKALTVKWKKASSKNRKQMTGYQIRYSTSSKMTKAKTVTVKSTSATSKTIKKLKAKKYYYVQIRTYKTVKGVKYYSGWSKAKKVKTK